MILAVTYLYAGHVGNVVMQRGIGADHGLLCQTERTFVGR
jgi:hypothetical protein